LSAADPYGRPHAEPPEVVLGGERMLSRLEDVLDGDETAKLAISVDDEHALEAVPVH